MKDSVEVPSWWKPRCARDERFSCAYFCDDQVCYPNLLEVQGLENRIRLTDALGGECYSRVDFS